MQRAARFFLSLYVYTLCLTASLIVTPLLTVVVAAGAPFTTHRRSMKRFRRFISWYGAIITRLPYPFITVRYEENSNNTAGEPCIFICNHRSASDPFLMCVLPQECVQIVNIWPFRIPVLGLYAKFAGYLNIRMMSHEQFMGKAGQLLADGVSIIFFPEGTRSAGREMGSFHGAAFRLALASRAPIVPICISGNEKIPPKGSLLLRPGSIRVRRLSAITWDEYKDLNAFAFKNRVRQIIEQELSEMENGADPERRPETGKLGPVGVIGNR